MAHPKGALIERLQRSGRQPRFETRSQGPDHEPTFDSEVVVDGEVLGEGSGSNKRVAERRAAEEALRRLDAREGDADAEPAPAEAAPRHAEQELEAATDAPFEGPWPMFERVLAASLTVANERVDNRLRGDEARVAIHAFAMRLYKDALEELAEVVEVDEDASAS